MRLRGPLALVVVLALASGSALAAGPRRGRARRPAVAKARVVSSELHPKDGVLVGRIEVTRGAAKPIPIYVTGRGVAELRKDGPPAWFDVASLRGKRILDVGTGDGQLVVELRRAGIDAVGIDLVRAPSIPADATWFHQADAADRAAMAGLGRGTFDVVMSSYAVFLYESPATQAAALRSLRDLVKPGGLIRLVGVRSVPQITHIAGTIGGLSITTGDPSTRSVELRKTAK